MAGIESILAALAQGGQPVGQLGKEPVGINPSAQVAGVPGQPETQSQVAGSGLPASPNPTAQAVGAADPRLDLILRALLQAGAFNQTQAQPVVGQ